MAPERKLYDICLGVGRCRSTPPVLFFQSAEFDQDTSPIGPSETRLN
jgi:hypothetical protein